MSSPCDIDTCKRKSRVISHCCNKKLCRDHFNQHDDSINSQVNSLGDQLNTVADQSFQIDVKQIIKNVRHKLDKWRDDCHLAIDRFYKEKCQELQLRYVEKVNNDLSKRNGVTFLTYYFLIISRTL
jgi:uncharacterized protein YbcC (UPF0753/DUF2309 family)